MTMNQDQLSTTKKKTNDNSNPQQGTSSALASSRIAAASKSSSSRAAVVSPSTFTGNYKPHSKINPTKRDDRKLFVGGLPSEVTDEDFKNYFAKYGSIVDSIVMIDRETGYSRGFGFVTFEDPAVANEVLDNNMKQDSKSRVFFAGKWCEVKASEPKTGHNSNNGNSVYNSKSGRGRGRPHASSPDRPEKNNSRTSSLDAARSVSTQASGASTKNVQQEGLRHGDTNTNENANASHFEEIEQGGHFPGHVDHQYYYYDHYHHPQNPHAYFYPQYMPNIFPPPHMGHSPYQYSYHPSHGATAPHMPPGTAFYNDQNAMMYAPTPPFHHPNYGNNHPQYMPPQPVGGEDGYAGQGQGEQQLSNEA